MNTNLKQLNPNKRNQPTGNNHDWNHTEQESKLHNCRNSNDERDLDVPDKNKLGMMWLVLIPFYIGWTQFIEAKVNQSYIISLNFNKKKSDKFPEWWRSGKNKTGGVGNSIN